MFHKGGDIPQHTCTVHCDYTYMYITYSVAYTANDRSSEHITCMRSFNTISHLTLFINQTTMLLVYVTTHTQLTMILLLPLNFHVVPKGIWESLDAYSPTWTHTAVCVGVRDLRKGSPCVLMLIKFDNIHATTTQTYMHTKSLLGHPSRSTKEIQHLTM